MEYALANFMAMYFNSHVKEGTPVKTAEDFLPFLKAWPEQAEGRYSEVDQSILKALMT